MPTPFLAIRRAIRHLQCLTAKKNLTVQKDFSEKLIVMNVDTRNKHLTLSNLKREMSFRTRMYFFQQ